MLQLQENGFSVNFERLAEIGERDDRDRNRACSAKVSSSLLMHFSFDST